MSTTPNASPSAQPASGAGANPEASCKVSASPHDAPPSPPGKRPAPPCTLVIFGAAGDLTKRLLMPALYNLSSEGLLDDKIKIIGVNHGELETSVWRDQLTESLKKVAADKAGAVPTSTLH